MTPGGNTTLGAEAAAWVLAVLSASTSVWALTRHANNKPLKIADFVNMVRSLSQKIKSLQSYKIFFPYLFFFATVNPLRLIRSNAGFTLIEMVVVVAIVGILASAAIPFVQYGQHRLMERELRLALREIRTAIDAYYKATEMGRIPRKVDASGYPPDLAALTEGVADAKTPDARKIYFLRRIPRDPFAPPGTPAADTWGLRSYASSPSEPQAGDDVFDVYSQSPGVGSNGAAYHDW